MLCCSDVTPDLCCSDAIGVKQAQVDKLYASLKDLAKERRGKLNDVLKLYTLSREIDDLEQWIAEREAIAGSHDLGQNFEHVCVSSSVRPLVSHRLHVHVRGAHASLRLRVSASQWSTVGLLGRDITRCCVVTSHDTAVARDV